MNFFNDEIHEEMLGLYRDFATGVCAPIAAEIDEEEIPCRVIQAGS